MGVNGVALVQFMRQAAGRKVFSAVQSNLSVFICR